MYMFRSHIHTPRLGAHNPRFANTTDVNTMDCVPSVSADYLLLGQPLRGLDLDSKLVCAALVSRIQAFTYENVAAVRTMW